eukprot:4607373-Alexandrium_andersonii.AAC.1
MLDGLDAEPALPPRDGETRQDWLSFRFGWDLAAAESAVVWRSSSPPCRAGPRPAPPLTFAAI